MSLPPRCLGPTTAPGRPGTTGRRPPRSRGTTRLRRATLKKHRLRRVPGRPAIRVAPEEHPPGKRAVTSDPADFDLWFVWSDKLSLRFEVEAFDCRFDALEAER